MNHFGIPKKPLGTKSGGLNQDVSKQQQIDKELQKCNAFIEEIEQDLKGRPIDQAPALKSDILEALDEFVSGLKAFIPNASIDQEKTLHTTQQRLASLIHDLESRTPEYLD